MIETKVGECPDDSKKHKWNYHYTVDHFLCTNCGEEGTGPMRYDNNATK